MASPYETVSNTGTATIKDREQLGEGDVALWRYWDLQEQIAEKVTEKWVKRGRKIDDRYRDERGEQSHQLHRYNVLWSNVQTLKPSLFSQVPKAVVSRRYRDQDTVGRLAATILERCIDFTLDMGDMYDVMDRVVDDRLLPGRGAMRVVYVPYYQDEEPNFPKTSGAPGAGPEELEDEPGQSAGNVASQGDEPENGAEAAPVEDKRVLVYEECHLKYEYWEDYLEGPARTWREVPWVRYRAYMTFDELVKRFGEKKARKITLDYSPAGSDQRQTEGQPPADAMKKAIIHEIWDREKKQVVWRAPGTPDLVLDQADDPLQIPDFFPGPDPIMATTTNKNRVPVADYVEYQDQARELDLLTARIDILTKALKVAGVYAAEQKQALQQLFDEGTENKLIPVEDWAAFATDKGGLEGLILWLPIKQVAEVLLGLFDAREKSKQVLFEITGMSDIIRGQSSPEETYGAQRIKNEFITRRLSQSQNDVKRFARDIVRLVGFIISTKFTDETISLISGYPQLLELPELPDEASTYHDQTGGQMVMNASMGQFIQQNQPILAENARRRKEFLRAIKLLREDIWHGFRLEIETDSTIEADEQAEQASRTQFLGEFVPLMNQMMPLAQGNPAVAAMSKEVIMFGMRGYRVSRSLEEAVEAAFDAIAQMPAIPPTKGNQKTPQELQTNMQIEQSKDATDRAEIASREKIEGEKLMTEVQASQAKQTTENKRLNLEALKLHLSERRATQQDNRNMAMTARSMEG